MNYFEIEKELFNLEEYLKTKNINVLYTLIVLLIESIFKMKDDYNPRKSALNLYIINVIISMLYII